MMNTSDAIWISGITAGAAVATAFVNMVGSVAILYIRARYGFRDQIGDKVTFNDVRNVPHT